MNLFIAVILLQKQSQVNGVIMLDSRVEGFVRVESSQEKFDQDVMRDIRARLPADDWKVCFYQSKPAPVGLIDDIKAINPIA